MGTLSLTKAGRLFWLGRYTERVMTALKETKVIYDAVVDGVEADYEEYCRKAGIPNVYSSTANFCRMYLSDKESGCSLVSTLNYAYDNGIVLRETIGTEALSYIQLACDAMERAIYGDSPELELQGVMDSITAFRGSSEYEMADETSRVTLRIGANIEHLSLALRFGYSKKACKKECIKMMNRLDRVPMTVNAEYLDTIAQELLYNESSEMDRYKLLTCVEGLFPEV